MSHRCCAMMMGLLLLAVPAMAAIPGMPADLDQRLNLALAYLAQSQRADGSLDDDNKPATHTALALMAFLSCGHTPDLGRYGLVVRNSVDYLLRQAPPEDSYYGKPSGSQLYGHAIVTLALAEVSGVESDATQRRRILTTLDQCVATLLKAQQARKKDPSHEGGWRYEPESEDSDLSVTGWCVLALRAAQNAGPRVPKSAIERATSFILNCHRPEQLGFSYMPRQEPSIAMTGAAVLNLCLMDARHRPEVAQAQKYLLQSPVTEQTRYFYYSLYYATQAAHQLDEQTWQTVWKNTYKQLAQRQLRDGAFRPAPGEPGNMVDPQRASAVYATSMAVLALSVPYRLLPIYQR